MIPFPGSRAIYTSMFVTSGHRQPALRARAEQLNPSMSVTGVAGASYAGPGDTLAIGDQCSGSRQPARHIGGPSGAHICGAVEQ